MCVVPECDRTQRRVRDVLERRQRAVGVDAGSRRILEVVAPRDDLLTCLADDEGDKPLGILGLLARCQNCGAGDVRNRSDVLPREVVEALCIPPFPTLQPQSVPVVLVDDPAGHISPVDGGDH